MSFGARAEVRLDALKSNLSLLKSRVPDCRVLAAVKANAYGHGIIRTARTLADADAFAVARLVEARVLRNAGIENDIVLMAGVIDRDELAEAAALRCDLVVHSGYQVALLEDSSLPGFRTWLKIDTGMHRLGVAPEEAAACVARLRGAQAVRVLGLMTHLSSADDPGDPASGQQMERFARVADGFEGDVSIANSAALLGWTDAVQPAAKWRVDGDTWIRPGISLYGISPLMGRQASELGLRAVMNFDTCLIAVKPLRAGEGVGYGGTWASPRDTTLGIAAAGYGDGYSRSIPSGTPVLVNGRRVGLAGVVSMDLLAVDLGPGATDRIGDPVRLWGEGLPVEEIAACAGTTSYALVTGVRDRNTALG